MYLNRSANLMASKMTLTVNGVVKNFKPATLEVYAGLLTVDNVGAKGLQQAVKQAGGEGFAASLLSIGEPGDTFEITKEITRKGKAGIVTGKTSRSNLANRILTALKADTFAVEITTVIDGATESSESSDGENWEMEVA